MSDFGNNSLKQYLKTNIKSKKWKMIEAKVLRKEYIERFTKRGNDEKFIEFICKNWFQFINDLKNEDCRQKIQLLQGQFLSDVAFW
jgi:hypothetical protein